MIEFPRRLSLAPPPLTTGARILRGFRRIGIVLAAVIALLGVIVTVTVSMDHASSTIRLAERDRCLSIAKRDGRLRVDVTGWVDEQLQGCLGWGRVPASSISDVPIEVPSYWITLASALAVGMGVTAVLALVGFVVPLLIGWIAAGFTRD